MHNSLHHLRTDERGMSLVFVAISLMALLSATTLAIDVGMFMNTRSQAQNAADAGALAGAAGLAFNSFTDRSSTGPAVVGAINTALANLVGGGQVSVTPADVTFPVGPTGQANRVQVQVFRTVDRSNPVPTLMGTFFGVQTVDIGATATAEVSPANSMTCVKPFMIPDKWTEKVDSQCKADGTWTTGSSFDEFDKKGNPCSPADTYIAAGQPGYTGYTVKNDVGQLLTLHQGQGSQTNPSFYYAWKMPGDIGGNFYRDNIDNCNTSVLTYDAANPYFMIQEPGDKQGPTLQGMQDLIDKDPTATWEPAPGCNCVRSTYPGQSPRVFPIPLFNPQVYAEGMATGRGATFELANFLGFFVVSVDPQGGILGYITNISGIVAPTSTAPPSDLFPTAIRLVQ